MPSPGDKHGWRRGSRTAVLTLLVLLAGCTGAERRKDNDPLTGGGQALPPRGETRADATTPPRSAVPPLPAPTASPSTAALADGALPSLDPTRDLRIGNGETKPAAGVWRGPAEQAKTTANPPQPEAEQRPPIQ